MIPLFDDRSERWLRPVTWVVILLNMTASLIVFNLPDETAAAVFNDYSIFSSSGFDLGNFIFRAIVSMHLHAGIVHLLSNMLFLFAFGISLENILGKAWFIMLYYAAGITGWACYYYFSSSELPAVGASGAISGLMASYLILFPKARFLSVWFILWVVRFLYVPAWIYITFWIILQMCSFLFISGSDVAYEAHVGGVACGLALGALLKFTIVKKAEAKK